MKSIDTVSQLNLNKLKRSQLIIIPAILAAYSMGGKEIFLGIHSDLVFVLMLAIVCINLLFELREIGKKN